jgi:hypothetical protein
MVLQGIASTSEISICLNCRSSKRITENGGRRKGDRSKGAFSENRANYKKLVAKG